MTTYEVRDAGKSQDYFISIPNMIDDMELSVHAFRLYAHYKRRAGDSGVCFESTDTLAKHCHMSMGTVSKARKELIKAKLISVTREKNKFGGKPKFVVTITDIWPENMAKYSPNKDKLPTSLDEQSTSPDEGAPRPTSLDEGATSLDEIKKNTVKKNKTKTVEEEFFNKPESEKRDPIDKDAYKDRITKAIETNTEDNQLLSLRGIDLSRYPEEVVPILAKVTLLWNIRPPKHSNKNGSPCSQWVRDARHLLDACGEFGVEAIVSFREKCEKYMDENNGLGMFPVNGPGSLVKSVRGHAAEMRQPKLEIRDDPFKGANMVVTKDGRIR